MARSVLQQGVADISGWLWRDLLKQEGFRRKAPHAFRAAGDLFHVIHFQGSAWGSADEGRFTVNIAVSHPDFYELWLDRPFGSNPATRLFPIQHRLGLPGGNGPQDEWWEITCSTDLETLAADLAQRLIGDTLPFFARLSSESALLEELRAGAADLGLWGMQDALHGFLAARSGSIEEAQEAFSRAILAGGPGFVGRIRTAADRYGVGLD